MSRFFFFILILGFGSHAQAMDKQSWCAALVADLADRPLEADSPLEHWIQRKKDGQAVSFDRKLQLALVVPVYRELENGNLMRLLARLQNQDLSPHHYRIVLVVNNTPAAARNRSRAFIENQETLSGLKSILAARSGSNHGRLNQLYLGNGAEVDVLDFSSQGTMRSMGHLRQIGFQHVLDTYRGNLNHLIVHQFDGDSLPSRQHFSVVMEHFSDPSVETLLSFMEFRLPMNSPASMLATHYRQRGSFGQFDRDLAMLSVSTYGGGPRIASRASLLKKIGGVPLVEGAEDLALLTKSEEWVDPNPQWRFAISTADRARADGYDAASRIESLAHDTEALSSPPKYQLEELGEIKKHLNQLSETLSAKENSLLESEILYWREQALLALKPGAVQNPFWETIGSSRFSSLNQNAGVAWDDLALDENGEMSASVELQYLNRALGRFYGLASQYPADFPGAARQALLARLRHRFLKGSEGCSGKAYALRARRQATFLLATEVLERDYAFEFGAEASLRAYQCHFGQAQWLNYVFGTWQDSIDGYELTPAMERRLIRNSLYLSTTTLLNSGNPEESLEELVRRQIQEHSENPRVVAMLLLGYEHIEQQKAPGLRRFARETVKPLLWGRLTFLLDSAN